MADVIAKYGKAGKHYMDGDIDLLNDTIKVFLLKSSYSPNMDTDEFQAILDLASNEIDTTGSYTKGTGLTLGNKAYLAYDAGNDRTPFDADDADAGTITAADLMYAVIVDTQSGAAATNILLALVTVDATKRAPSAQPFKIQWSADGIFAM